MNILKTTPLYILIFFLSSSYVMASGLKVPIKPSSFAVDIARDHIDITVGFNGSSIELFGDRRDNNAVVAIVIEGPRKDVTIWQKARVMGTWVNRYYVKFDDMPTYYNYAISADKINNKLSKAMKENFIGHDAVFYKLNSDRNKKLENIKVFQDALLDKNYQLGVFSKNPPKINFINDNFFRVSFDVPPAAPKGEYKIHSFLIKDGIVVEHIINNLKVGQVGLNAFIYKAAHNYSLLYAIICIAMALFAGWLVSSIRVRP